MDETDTIFDTEVPILNHLTYREWHSFINGVAAELSPNAAADENAQPAYYNAGILLAYTLTDE